MLKDFSVEGKTEISKATAAILGSLLLLILDCLVSSAKGGYLFNLFYLSF